MLFRSAVAASDASDVKAGFSCFGLNSVDLAAPGVGVLSTYNSSNSSYTLLSGTSMATPHTAGAAALLSAFNPGLSPASLKATLMNNVDSLAAWNGIVKTGGRLNVFKAMQNPTVCNFTAGTGSMKVPTKGGVFTVSVPAGPNCDYSVTSSSNWIKVLTPSVMSGAGSVTFRVPVNPSITRSGTIVIGGQSFAVNQSRN